MSKTLTSPTHVKRYALDVSTTCRGGKFSRVSKRFLDRIEANTRNFVAAQVKAHPSVGKTLF